MTVNPLLQDLGSELSSEACGVSDLYWLARKKTDLRKYHVLNEMKASAILRCILKRYCNTDLTLCPIMQILNHHFAS